MAQNKMHNYQLNMVIPRGEYNISVNVTLPVGKLLDEDILVETMKGFCEKQSWSYDGELFVGPVVLKDKTHQDVVIVNGNINMGKRPLNEKACQEVLGSLFQGITAFSNGALGELFGQMRKAAV